jgi:transcriptional regulator with XRE-family HTH domain
VSFRRELKALIARRSISQREFAARCKKSPAWASRILRGSLPLKSLDEVLMIGKVLELPAEEVNRLCQGYQSETDSAYGVLLHEPGEHGARLALVDESRDPAAWRSAGGETISGTFCVVARSVVGPEDGVGELDEKPANPGAEPENADEGVEPPAAEPPRSRSERR